MSKHQKKVFKVFRIEEVDEKVVLRKLSKKEILPIVCDPKGTTIKLCVNQFMSKKEMRALKLIKKRYETKSESVLEPLGYN